MGLATRQMLATAALGALPIMLFMIDALALAVFCVLNALLLVAPDMAVGTGAALHTVNLRFAVLKSPGFALG